MLRKMSNSGIRVVVTKKGTYVFWYDSMFNAPRHLNISKEMNSNKYFGTGRGCR
jgi:hypothetical protein